MESRPVNLPTLIFADNNHFSPLLPSLLTKLAPKLKNLGYDHFYDEMNSDNTVEYQIRCQKQTIQNGKEILRLCQQIQDLALSIIEREGHSDLEQKIMESIDKDDPAVVEIAKSFIMSFGMAKKSLAALFNGSSSLMKALLHDALVNQVRQFTPIMNQVYSLTPFANKNFLLSLRDNQINYCHADEGSKIVRKKFDEMDTLKNESSSFDDFESKLLSADCKVNKDEIITNRDKGMIDFYLQASQAVFGRVGALHIEGMQKFILEKMSLEEAQTKFCFFYPYEGPAFTMDLMQMQNGEKSLQLGISSINANNCEIDSVVDGVVKIIEEKIAALRSNETSTHFVSPSNDNNLESNAETASFKFNPQ